MGLSDHLAARDTVDVDTWLAALRAEIAHAEPAARRALWRTVAADLEAHDDWYRVMPDALAAELAMEDAVAAEQLALRWHAHAVERYGAPTAASVTAELQLLEVRANLGVHDPAGCGAASAHAPSEPLRKRAAIDAGCALIALGETHAALAAWRDADSDVVAVAGVCVLHGTPESPRAAIVTALREALREDTAPQIWGIGDARFVRALHALALRSTGSDAAALDDDITRRCAAALFASEAEGSAATALASLGGRLEIAGEAFDLAPLRARGERLLAEQRLAHY